MLRYNRFSFIFLLISFAGLALVAITAHQPTIIREEIVWRRPVIGAIFSCICILGILAGVFPSECSRAFHLTRVDVAREKSVQESTTESKTPFTFLGHHPSCGSFDEHVFRIGRRCFCAGCIGLILGAILSLFGNILFFFLEIPVGFVANICFYIGFLAVSGGLLQYHFFNLGKSSVHLFLNTSLVFGVFLLLIGVDEIGQSIFLDVFVVALSIFWIFTKIFLSQDEHRRICLGCSVEECRFHRRTHEGSG